MAKTEEGGNRATQQVFSMQVSNFPSDLLRRIVSGNNFRGNLEEPAQDSEEIELSLGLSLNGRFGVDPRAKLLPLKRSSSIPDFASTPARDEETTCRVLTPSTGLLMRTCSLPTETEEEWRKRKDLQSLRRLEAKRKRSEKQQRNLKVPRDRSRESCEEDKRVEAANGRYSQRQEQFVKVVDEFRAMGMPTWVPGGGEKGNRPIPAPPAAASQGTIGSRRSGSFGISESDSQAFAAQGVHQCTEGRSDGIANVQGSPKGEKEQVATAPMLTSEGSGQFDKVQMENNCRNKLTLPDKGANEIVRNVLESMPCVSTIGDGPNGKRIEGFLYRYKKGEEVRIVCVCHGSFLSPAEFVKHAGGTDVANPLKHIVVNPTPFL